MSFDIPQIPQQHLFLLFLLYSFVGWVCEEIWVSTLYRKIEKRGMLAGPVCPIYGFEALIILFAIYPWLCDIPVAGHLGEALYSVCRVRLGAGVLFKLAFGDALSHQVVGLLKSTLQPKRAGVPAFGVSANADAPNAYEFVDLHSKSTNSPRRESAVGMLFTIRRLVTFSEAMERLKMFSEQLRERYEGEAWFNADDLHATLAELKARLDEGKIQASQRMKERVEHFTGNIRGTEVFFRKFPTMTSRDWKPQMEHARLAFKESVEKKIAQKKQQKKQRKGNS